MIYVVFFINEPALTMNEEKITLCTESDEQQSKNIAVSEQTNEINEPELSGTASDVENDYDLTDDEPSIRGWLWIYLVRLGIGTLIALKLLTSYGVYISEYLNVSAMIFYIINVVFPLYTILAIFKRLPNAVFLAKTIEILNLLACVFAVVKGEDYFYDALGKHYTLITTGVGIIWLAYLYRSKLLKCRFPQRKRYIFDYVLIAGLLISGYTMDIKQTPPIVDPEVVLPVDVIECDFSFDTPNGFTCSDAQMTDECTDYFITDSVSMEVFLRGASFDVPIVSKSEFAQLKPYYEAQVMLEYRQQVVEETLTSKGDVYTYYSKVKFLDTNTPLTIYWIFVIKYDPHLKYAVLLSGLCNEINEPVLNDIISSITIKKK